MTTTYIMLAIGMMITFFTLKKVPAVNTMAKKMFKHSDQAFMLGFFLLCMGYVIFLLLLLITFPQGYSL